MSRTMKKHLICLLVTFMPICFTLGISVFDLSFLVPVSEDILTFLSPTEGLLSIFLHPLISIVAVYALMYSAQNEEWDNWSRIVFGLGGVVIALVLTSVYSMVWVRVVYVIMPKLEQGW